MHATASRYAIVANESYVKIHTRSTLHDINGKGTGITGWFEAAFFGDRLSTGTRTRMHVDIPVSKLDSGNAIQDREMHKLISSKSYPNISADLTSASAKEQPNDYSVSGSVTVRGTTRLLTGHLLIRQRDGRVEIDGEKTLDVRQLGVQPPKFFNLQVYPEVHVTLHVIATLET